MFDLSISTISERSLNWLPCLQMRERIFCCHNICLELWCIVHSCFHRNLRWIVWIFEAVADVGGQDKVSNGDFTTAGEFPAMMSKGLFHETIELFQKCDKILQFSGLITFLSKQITTCSALHVSPSIHNRINVPRTVGVFWIVVAVTDAK